MSEAKNIIDAVAFSPVAFIGVDWSYAEARNPRSAALGLLDDYSKVKLSTEWLEGQSHVYGETHRTRIIADVDHISLNADHFFDLWNNKEKIPEEWKKASGVITFDGDVLLSPNGSRCVLCLYWYGDGWRWYYDGLLYGWFAYNPSAVVES